MTKPVLATKATEVFKTSTDPKQGEDSEINKGTEVEELNQELNTLNKEIKWIIVKSESSEIESTSLLKIKFNKSFKKQMKVLIQTIEESRFPDPEQLNLLPEVTLQIFKKPKINYIINLDKRFRLLSKQKRQIKEEDKVDDPKSKCKYTKDKKKEETMENELPEWEVVEKTHWILEQVEELELWMQFLSGTLDDQTQA